MRQGPSAACTLKKLRWQTSNLDDHPFPEPKDLEPLRPGYVYVAPRYRHLVVGSPGGRRASRALHPAGCGSLDALRGRGLRSAAVGVVLTGGGSDGLAGLLAVKAAGGIALVQDPNEAVGRSMPCMAILNDHVDGVLPLARIAPALVALANGETITDLGQTSPRALQADAPPTPIVDPPRSVVDPGYLRIAAIRGAGGNALALLRLASPDGAVHSDMQSE
jgi:hypothetical protein